MNTFCSLHWTTSASLIHLSMTWCFYLMILWILTVLLSRHWSNCWPLRCNTEERNLRTILEYQLETWRFEDFNLWNISTSCYLLFVFQYLLVWKCSILITLYHKLTLLLNKIILLLNSPSLPWAVAWLIKYELFLKQIKLAEKFWRNDCVFTLCILFFSLLALIYLINICLWLLQMCTYICLITVKENCAV